MFLLIQKITNAASEYIQQKQFLNRNILYSYFILGEGTFTEDSYFLHMVLKNDARQILIFNYITFGF